MAFAVTVQTNAKDLERFLRVLPSELQTQIGMAMFNYAAIIRENLKLELMNDPLRPVPTPNRKEARNRIVAEKVSKFRSVVKMPQSLKNLDRLPQRTILLERNRSLNRWARRNIVKGNNIMMIHVSGDSKVKFGPRGGLRGKMVVTPHPFVNKALIRSKNRLPKELRKGVRKAFRKAISRGG